MVAGSVLSEQTTDRRLYSSLAEAKLAFSMTLTGIAVVLTAAADRRRE
jgi:hypothetical protein